MKLGHMKFTSSLIAAIVFIHAEVSAQEWANVGAPGNTPDPASGFGSVAHEYRISKHEVTNLEYAEFLNAVATTDPVGLWDSAMATFPRCGITRSGTAGNFTYSLKPDMANKPVNYVSFYDAVRFCNWLHNGKPIGPQSANTTENGAYEIVGSEVGERKMLAKFFLPTENEWYKAAYFNPELNNGTGGYWLYPTQSNDLPETALVDTTGTVTNPGPFIINWKSQAIWNSQTGNVTSTASCGNTSPWGIFDMGGNVEEMNETIVAGTNRGFRGGSWNLNGASTPLSTNRNLTDGQRNAQYQSRGFRIASLSDTADSDNDGLLDFAETSLHHTEPFNNDSDSDGFLDGYEINSGRNPLDSSSTPEGNAALIHAVEFQFSAALNSLYQIESSTDLMNWTIIETNIQGNGALITRLYSIQGKQKRFFRAVRY